MLVPPLQGNDGKDILDEDDSSKEKPKQGTSNVL